MIRRRLKAYETGIGKWGQCLFEYLVFRSLGQPIYKSYKRFLCGNCSLSEFLSPKASWARVSAYCCLFSGKLLELHGGLRLSRDAVK